MQAGGKREQLESAEARDGAKRLRTASGPAPAVAAARSCGEAVEAAQQAQLAPSVRLTVCRDGAVALATVALATEDGLGTDALVHFCGAQVQVRWCQSMPIHA